MSAIEARVARVELGNRILNVGFLMGAGALFLLLFNGATSQPSKTVEADTIVFRDAKGRPRMELKRGQADGSAEEFGIWFMNPAGEAVGSLRMKGDELSLAFERSAASRRASRLQALALTEKLWKEKGKTAWNQREKDELVEDITKIGRLQTNMSSNGITFADWDSRGPFLTQLNEESLITRSVVVAADAGIEAMRLTRKGCVTVSDGSVRTRSSKDDREAVLGEVSLTDPKTGDAIETSASSLTLFDKDGKVIFRAP